MITKAQAVDSSVLFRQLNGVDGLVSSAVQRSTIREARTQQTIAAAQMVLEAAGYVLTDWKMVEGDFYQLTYIPGNAYAGEDHWPYWFKLQLITDGLAYPPLALTYFDEHGELIRYKASDQMVYGTGSTDAMKLLYRFKTDFPDEKHRWLPIFDDHWPVVSS